MKSVTIKTASEPIFHAETHSHPKKDYSAAAGVRRRHAVRRMATYCG
jgi:hypothetical protein